MGSWVRCMTCRATAAVGGAERPSGKLGALHDLPSNSGGQVAEHTDFVRGGIRLQKGGKLGQE